MTLSFLSKSRDETEGFARDFAARLTGGDVIAFRGDLGAGKTSFTRGLAEGLGVDSDDVSSPTFALLNVYKGSLLELYHFDMYRVMGIEALESTGFFDYLNESGGVTAVEWSENIQDEIPSDAIVITITPVSENERLIEIEGGERF